MRVRTLLEIQTPQGIIPTGQILTISDAAFKRLAGKVEPIHQAQPQPAGGANGPRAIRKCSWCGSSDMWRVNWPHEIIYRCRKCHPPAPGAELEVNP